MVSISEAELKAGLTALKDIKQAILQRGGGRAGARTAGHRAALMRAGARTAGHRAALMRAESMHHGLVSLRKSAEHLASLATPLVTQTVFINAPFLIWASPSSILKASQIEPWNSWAKASDVVMRDLFNDWDDVSFFYLWQNETGSDVVVNASTLLVAYGFCEASAPPLIWATATLNLSAMLWVYEWWNQPPTMLMSQDDGFLNLSVTGSIDPFADFSIDSTQVSYPANLGYQNFWIPRDGVAVFEVDLRIWFYMVYSGGRDEADFDSGDYQIICPYLRLDMFTPLPSNAP